MYNNSTLIGETIVMQLKRNDLESAKQVSKLLDVQNHHVLISKLIEAWYYHNLNQDAYSLTILDQLYNDSKDVTNEVALFVSIQALIISSLNNNIKETQKRYNEILNNFNNFPVRFLLPLAQTIYSNGEEEILLHYSDDNNSDNNGEDMLNEYLSFNYQSQNDDSIQFIWKIMKEQKEYIYI